MRSASPWPYEGPTLRFHAGLEDPDDLIADSTDGFKAMAKSRLSVEWVLNRSSTKSAFNDDGLVPAVAQQHDSGEVLMMAWMNEDAVRETLASGRVCYFSRSRQALWRKGESSGQVQRLIDFRIDCDGDTYLIAGRSNRCCLPYRTAQLLLLRVPRRSSCRTIAAVEIPPEQLYGKAD